MKLIHWNDKLQIEVPKSKRQAERNEKKSMKEIKIWKVKQNHEDWRDQSVLIWKFVTVYSETRTNVAHHISAKRQEDPIKSQRERNKTMRSERTAKENQFEKLAGQSKTHQRLKYEGNHGSFRSSCCSFFSHPLHHTLSRYLPKQKHQDGNDKSNHRRRRIDERLIQRWKQEHQEQRKVLNPSNIMLHNSVKKQMKSVSC